MTTRRLAGSLALLALVLAPAAAPAQAPDGPKATALPAEYPDVSGVFTFRTLTPLQRPDALADRATLSPEEAAAFEASERTRLNRDLFDPSRERRAPATSRGPRAGCCPTTSSGTSAASS